MNNKKTNYVISAITISLCIIVIFSMMTSITMTKQMEALRHTLSQEPANETNEIEEGKDKSEARESTSRIDLNGETYYVYGEIGDDTVSYRASMLYSKRSDEWFTYKTALGNMFKIKTDWSYGMLFDENGDLYSTFKNPTICRERYLPNTAYSGAEESETQRRSHKQNDRFFYGYEKEEDKANNVVDDTFFYDIPEDKIKNYFDNDYPTIEVYTDSEEESY